ncbi:MAG: (E)-4-hydroxy-3-methylbut-2-enyl-diphosphate synthase [Chitinophagaceae bacterium]
MQLYAESLTSYQRLKTRQVNVGGLFIGSDYPIRVQTMTTTDTMNTAATVAQTIRCIEAGAELVRITAPSKKEAENLANIKKELRDKGYSTPLIADIHFTPNAAEIAARIIEKVRVNPGNYIDKKKFQTIEYSDADYAEEIDRIYDRFSPLVKICKEYGTAMRIGTNHGSLSDRIMSRYGDTPMGMVESAMEFLRVARNESYHNIILSMKSSNPLVMVQAYRLLIQQMNGEFGEIYPLHLGVTEAGDGEDGRIKSSVGIGTLLEDGIGDTIRVSLTEDPEIEIPVCKNLVKRYTFSENKTKQISTVPSIEKIPYDPFAYQRRKTFEVNNIGANHVPVVVADFSKMENISRETLLLAGYSYIPSVVSAGKWNTSDASPDYIYTGNKEVDFDLPGTLKIILDHSFWLNKKDERKYVPILSATEYINEELEKSVSLNFVMIDCYSDHFDANLTNKVLAKCKSDRTVVLCLSSTNKNAMQSIRRMFMELQLQEIKNPVVLICDSTDDSFDEALIHFAVETGALFLEGFGDGISLGYFFDRQKTSNEIQLLNSISFGILQATRTRISKTEYISCPSCGRTLFDLQETTAMIRAKTNHLKGVKIAIMGCIVNGPGEMADADFGYVGSGVGKITLYKGKEVVKRQLDAAVAVDELINLLKESDVWVDIEDVK